MGTTRVLKPSLSPSSSASAPSPFWAGVRRRSGPKRNYLPGVGVIGVGPGLGNGIKARARPAVSFHFVTNPVDVNTRLNLSLLSSTLFVVGRVSRLSNSDGLQIKFHSGCRTVAKTQQDNRKFTLVAAPLFRRPAELRMSLS